MAVLTRPDDGVPKPQIVPDDEWKVAPLAMSVRLANALVTYAPMSMEELQIVRAHFLALIKQIDDSGPTFSAMRRQAVDMHNKAVQRINGVNEEARRRAMEDPDRLMEIER